MVGEYVDGGDGKVRFVDTVCSIDDKFMRSKLLDESLV
jgi:hypothetical protein